jgi:uncharacterized membrane protein
MLEFLHNYSFYIALIAGISLLLAGLNRMDRFHGKLLFITGLSILIVEFSILALLSSQQMGTP